MNYGTLEPCKQSVIAITPACLNVHVLACLNVHVPACLNVHVLACLTVHTRAMHMCIRTHALRHAGMCTGWQVGVGWTKMTENVKIQNGQLQTASKKTVLLSGAHQCSADHMSKHAV